METRLVIALLLLAGAPGCAGDRCRQPVRGDVYRLDGQRSLLRSRHAGENSTGGRDARSRFSRRSPGPAERTIEWDEYRDIFLTDARISAGADFWREHAQACSASVPRPASASKSSSASSVWKPIMAASPATTAYSTRCRRLPSNTRPRSKFFRGELEHFLLLVREEGMEASAATGSYAGAMGSPQFMPSSFRAYAVDSTGRRQARHLEQLDGRHRAALRTISCGMAGTRASKWLRRQAWATSWQGDTLPENTLKPEETVDLAESPGRHVRHGPAGRSP